MFELILMVFGACFIGISFIVFLVCMLLGEKHEDVTLFGEKVKMDRFMEKYLEYEESKAD